MGTMKVATVVGLGTGFLLAACNALTGVDDLEVKEGTAAAGGASGTGGSATGGTGGTGGGGATGGTGGGTTGGAGGTDTGGTGGTGTGGSDTGGTGGTETGGSGGTGPCNNGETECVGPMQIRTCDGGVWGAPETCASGTTACVQGRCSPAIALGAGPRHTCAVLQGDVTYLYCWGGNGFGQLGVGDYNNTHHTPQLVGLVNVVQIALGLEHMCAATNDGSLHCWGANSDGQIGIGTFGSSETTPKPVTSLTGVTRVAAGIHFSCAYGKVGTVQGVYCWGKNNVGQLGTGEAGDGFHSVSPIKVIGLPAAGVESLSAGDAHACAIFDNGEVYCWGFNARSQLGTGSTNTFEHTPAKLTHGFLGTSLYDISAGGWHTCLRANTIVECWGGNFAGQLGNGTSGAPEQTPVKAGNPTQHFLSVDSGGQHTCGIDDQAGGVMCWGANTFGQLGTGDQIPSDWPVSVQLPGGTSVFQVAAGGESGDVDDIPPNGHTCVTTHAGPIYCWGHNNFGQLGDGKDVKSSVPVKVVW